MTQIFHIENEGTRVAQQVLCEWGETYCCWGSWNKDTNVINDFFYYTFERGAENELKEIVEKLKQSSAIDAQLYFASAFPQSVLVPSRFAKESMSFASGLFGAEGFLSHKQKIENWQIVHEFLVPQQLEKSLTEHFSQIDFTHVYSNIIATLDLGAEASLYVHFIPGQFRVLVLRENNIVLAQTYAYTAPLDIVYYLLKISEEFTLDKEQTKVTLSGLIEEDSALFQEITNYFLLVDFAQTTSMMPGSKLPAHYFSSLFNQASCALLAVH